MNRSSPSRTARATRVPWSAVPYAAASWATLFGLASLYVAGGGSVGESLVAPALVTALEQREPTMLITLWVAGLLKLASGAALLVANHRVGGRWRRIVAVGYAVLGVGLAAWGAAEGGTGLLVVTDAIGPPDGWGDGAVGIYYAALWGPYWLVGGYLYVAAGVHLRRTSPDRVSRPDGSAR